MVQVLHERGGGLGGSFGAKNEQTKSVVAERRSRDRHIVQVVNVTSGVVCCNVSGIVFFLL